MRLAILILLCLVVTSIFAKKHHRKHHEKKHFRKAELEKDVLDLIAEDDADEEKKIKAQHHKKLENIKFSGGYVNDPCQKHHCGPGKHCEVGEDGKPECVCVKSCARELDDRRKVCSNHNETWESDCHLYRMRCLCVEDDIACRHRKYKHAHVNYYGSCKEITPCSNEEMKDFPRRMRDWLFNVMQDLAHRDQLNEPYIQLEQEAERRSDRKWVNAVIWKFCDLDVHPHDRSVSRHELFPIRAMLLSMEHCIAPFLDRCDSNNDHRITLLEWGSCLGLKENEIEDKCPTSVRRHHG